MNEHGKFIRTIDLNQIEKYATPELINHCLLDLDQGITLVVSFRSYKHRIDQVTDPHCLFCPGEEHNLEHWLTKCAQTTGVRMRIFGTLDPSLQVLTTNPAGALELARETLLSAPEP